MDRWIAGWTMGRGNGNSEGSYGLLTCLRKVTWSCAPQDTYKARRLAENRIPDNLHGWRFNGVADQKQAGTERGEFGIETAEIKENTVTVLKTINSADHALSSAEDIKPGKANRQQS